MNNNKGLWYLFVLVIAVIALGGGLYWYSHKGNTGAVEGTSTQAAPAAVQEAVRTYAASRLAVPASSVTIVSSVAHDWPDSCLGLAEVGESCAQVITSGYEVTIDVNGTQYNLRTNADGSVIRGTGVLQAGEPFHDKG